MTAPLTLAQVREIAASEVVQRWGMTAEMTVDVVATIEWLAEQVGWALLGCRDYPDNTADSCHGRCDRAEDALRAWRGEA